MTKSSDNTANPGSIDMNQDSTTYRGSNTTHTNSKDFFKSKLNFQNKNNKVDTKKIIQSNVNLKLYKFDRI